MLTDSIVMIQEMLDVKMEMEIIQMDYQNVLLHLLAVYRILMTVIYSFIARMETDSSKDVLIYITLTLIPEDA
jgi:hypothetical protein